MYILECKGVKLIVTGPDSPVSLDRTKLWENSVDLNRKDYAPFQAFFFLFLITTPPFFAGFVSFPSVYLEG